VRAECLEWALARDERFGIWGGLTEAERREIGKARQLAAQPGDRGPSLTARGDGRGSVAVRFRLAGGARAQLSTTVCGERRRAVGALARLQARAEQLATNDVAGGRVEDGQEVA